MPIETSVTHIADLEPLYPFGTDNRLQGDNHIRNIKTALKNDLPLTTPATATGIALLTAANAAAARTTLGSTTVGDAVYIASSQAAAQSALGVYSIAGTDTAISTAVSGINVAQIQPVAASVASNDLTATINPTKLDFRSTTLTSGTISTVTLASAASLVVPNGATLGTTNSIAARLVLLAINNAGAIEVAIINLSGGVDLSETGLISTTALSTGSDSANVAYSTTARTSLAYRVVGVIDITQTTAGTWASAPTLVQGVGGMSPSSLPSARSWKSPTRVAATTYTNTTAREREVLITCTDVAGTSQMVVTINGSTHLISGGFDGNGGTFRPSASFTVPVGSTYSISLTGASLSSWKELD